MLTAEKYEIEYVHYIHFVHLLHVHLATSLANIDMMLMNIEYLVQFMF